MKFKIDSDYSFPIIFGLVYLVFNYFHLSENLTLSHDSIYYLIDITQNPNILHPHHLLFFPFSSILSKVFISLGIDSISKSIAIQSAVAGSLILIIIYFTLRRNFDFSKYSARLAVILSSVVYAFWFYSLSIETYHLPLIFIFMSLYFITKKELTLSIIMLSAFWGGIAVLFHQLHALFGVVVVMYLILYGFRKNFKNIIIFSLIFNIVWIAVYSIAIYQMEINSIDSFNKWFFKYNYEVNSWSSLDTSFFIKPFVGIIRSFLTIHPLFIFNDFSSVILNIFSNKEFSDDAFIVRNFSVFYFYLYLILSFLIAFTFVSLLVIKRKEIINKFSINKEFRIVHVFLIVYSLFFLFWDSSNLEFWIPQSMLICVIIAYSSGNINNKYYKYLVPAFCVVSLFYINYQYTISLVADKSNNYFYNEVSEAKSALPDSSVIIYDRDWIVKPSYQIYSEIDFLSIKSLDTNFTSYELNSTIDSILNSNRIVAVKSSLINSDFKFFDYVYTIDSFGINQFHIFKNRK